MVLLLTSLTSAWYVKLTFDGQCKWDPPFIHLLEYLRVGIHKAEAFTQDDCKCVPAKIDLRGWLGM